MVVLPCPISTPNPPNPPKYYDDMEGCKHYSGKFVVVRYYRCSRMGEIRDEMLWIYCVVA